MNEKRIEPSLIGENRQRFRSAGKESIRQKKHKKTKREGLFFRLIKWMLILVIWGTVAAGSLIVWYGYDLPDIHKLQATVRQPGITLLARDGSLIATYGELYGTQIKLEELPAHTTQALLATEDRRFYEHFGVDIFGVMRAIWNNYRRGGVVQGGSTITQQLAKNFLLSEKLFSPQDRSLRRKVQELLLAFWLESNLTKDQILSIYLNRVYFGAGTYGLEAASQKYFGKSASDLSLYESAILAGLLKAPSKYSPLTHPEAAEGRAKVVLENMVKVGFISEQEAKFQRILLKNPSSNANVIHKARYFADWIMETLHDFVGDVQQDLIIKTTLDLKLQNLADESYHALLDKEGQAHRVSQGAMIAMTPDGGVRALIGGRDYQKSQFNRATQARRQPGSAFKLFLFLAALEKGYDLQTIVSDLPVQVGKWRPKNDDHWQSKGDITFEEAFAESVNTSAVRIISDIGYKPVIEVASRLGLLGEQPKNLTLALGTGEASLLEMTAAYASVMNHGFGVWPYGILEVKTPEGVVLYQRRNQGASRVIDKENVVKLLYMLQKVMEYGTGKRSILNRPCAGKTGTTQNYNDGWFIGFTPDLVTGVWMGNDDNVLMKKVPGGGLPAQLWKNFMETAHSGLPIKNFPDF